MSVNKLILGDNLEILRGLESETIDLIYLDPPFFSNRNYEVIWGDAGEVRSFQDRWSGGMEHYIAWLYERVEQMHRILKPTGSIFLHCDWHADAYIRVHILDKIFGINNFIAEIVWLYSWGIRTLKRWNRKHDVIYHYSKTKDFIFNVNEVLDKRILTESSQKRLEYNGAMIMKNADTSSNPDFILPSDVWYIATINAMSKERIGYPTQKPEALLERIIKASSNEGNLILDPFVGGGTTVAVADRLKRNWIGIDQSVQAVKVTEMRLDKQRDLFSEAFSVQLHKYDYDTLRHKDTFEFENFIITQYGGVMQNKKSDNGKMYDSTPVLVKRSNNIGCEVINKFISVVQCSDKKLFDKNIADGKPVGHIIAFSFGKDAVQEVARLKLEENIVIKLVTVDEIVPIAKKPTLTVETSGYTRLSNEVWEIDFTAKSASKAGIEFYSWDFEYKEENKFKADVMLDKEGVQRYKFKAGQHTVAVKVVDNDGLENIEVIKLKVNGIVERE